MAPSETHGAVFPLRPGWLPSNACAALAPVAASRGRSGHSSAPYWCGPRLADAGQVVGIERRRMKAPRTATTSARSHSAVCKLFFERDLLCLEKPPQVVRPTLSHARPSKLRGFPARSCQLVCLPAPITPSDARPSANGDRLLPRGLERDPRPAAAAPSESRYSRLPQIGPPPPTQMSPSLLVQPRVCVYPPNIVLAPTIGGVTTIADPWQLQILTLSDLLGRKPF
jgi:hypothetical protein